MNILLVEDDIDSCKYLGKFLRQIGHHVVECHNGQDALEFIKSQTFHMVLTDLQMPRMSGIELLNNISTLPLGRDVAVVLFTGHGDMQSVIEALRAGAYDYLLKPINIEELTLIIERIADNKCLRKENKLLTERFEEEVNSATEETGQELLKVKKAYAQLVGITEIGVFSDSSKQLFEQAVIFHSDRSIPILIQGDTGTGKEVIAKYIHFGNQSDTAPFVDINCAALPPNLFESELFGYEAGAFTGGLPRGQKGKLDLARGGTIFLDEITELPTEIQAKLLRVIQEKEYYRVGGLKKVKTDVRIICATNADIEENVSRGKFRQDLFYRLNVGRIFIPPLRKRKEEILPLAKMFMKNFSKERGKKFSGISEASAIMLKAYHWPGNIRELMNVIQFIVFSFNDIELKPEHLSSMPQFSLNPSLKNVNDAVITIDNCPLPAGSLNLDSLCDSIVFRALEMHRWNKAKTARYLGITRRALYYRLERLSEGM